MVDGGAGGEEEMGGGEGGDEILAAFNKDGTIGWRTSTAGGGAVDDEVWGGVISREVGDLVRGGEIAGVVVIFARFGEADDVVGGASLAGDFAAKVACSGDENVHGRE